MTAKAFAEDKARCFDANMDDFITKPVAPENLYATLLKCLEKRLGMDRAFTVSRTFEGGHRPPEVLEDDLFERDE
jgi:DNA-binding response OmpR family regulator